MISELKNKILCALDSIEVDKLTLCELDQFARIFDITVKIEEKSYFDALLENFKNSGSGFSTNAKTISEMREESK